MRFSRRGVVSEPLDLLVLSAFSLIPFVNRAVAQRTSTDNDDPEPTSQPDPPEETEPPAPTPTRDDNDEETVQPPPPSRTTSRRQTTEEPEPEPTTEDERPSRTQNLPGLTTDDPSTATPTETDSGGPLPGLPSLPSLPGGVRIPTPTIPPKEGAPYLQQTNAPEGTVFIAVGAGLGLIALAVIAWRVLVAWSINRSVRRAANNAHQSDATALLRPKTNKKKGGVYRQPAGSAMSMEKLGHSARQSGLPPPSHAPSTGLFFSPTAGASMHSAGNRGSGYLPAGYYAASNSTPGSGAGLAHLNGSSIGLWVLSLKVTRARDLLLDAARLGRQVFVLTAATPISLIRRPAV
jgi:hypothetical protein